MIPPCAQNVLQSFGSAAFVTSSTRTPALARQNVVVSPAMPVPMTSTGQCSRFLSGGTAREFILSVAGLQSGLLMKNHVDAGREALRRGAWAKARDAFAAAVKREPAAEALEGLGWALYWLDAIDD